MIKTIALKFSENLKKFRKSKNLTQQQLAEITGVEYKYIQRLEGKNPPLVRIDTLDRIAKALKIKTYTLLK